MVVLDSSRRVAFIYVYIYIYIYVELVGVLKVGDSQKMFKHERLGISIGICLYVYIYIYV
jgi:hypothetical protein